MKIEERTFVCPKCKKEYKNRKLLSYWGGMADAAKSFIKNNKNATTCENCGLRLVDKENLKYYNDKGEFDFKTIVTEFPKGKEFEFYCDMVVQIARVKECIDFSSIYLEGVLEKVQKERVDEKENKNYLINRIKIKVKSDKEYVLYDVILGKVDYADIGSRYNSFMIEYYSKVLASTVEFLCDALAKDIKVKAIKKSINIDFEKRLLKYMV